MKIFVLTTSYPDLDHPNRDIFVYEQTKALIRCGHDVLVLNVKKLPSKKLLSRVNRTIRVVDDIYGKRVQIDLKTFAENKAPGLNKKSFINAMVTLFEYAKECFGCPDVLYAHFSCWAGYAGTVISNKYCIPLVTIEHNSKLMKSPIPRALKIGVKDTICGSDKFLCVSDGLKKSILQNIYSGKDIMVMPNMIDDKFKFSPRYRHSRFRFLSIGNLSKRKGMKELIEAFISSFSVDDNVELVIGGDGVEYGNIKKQIEQASRQQQIKLIGRLTREETIEEYVGCDCFVLASKFETYGLVYREALATGRPIITTEHGGFSGSDWHDEYGFKIPVDDIKALSEGMKKIVADYDKYDLETISRLCLEDCSSVRISNRLTAVFDEVINDRLRRNSNWA